MSLGYVNTAKRFSVQRPPPLPERRVEDAVTAEEQNRSVTTMWRLTWFVTSLLFSTTAPVAFMISIVPHLPMKPSLRWTPYALAAIIAAISVLTWLRNMLSMNLFIKRRRVQTRFVAIVLYLLGGICWLASSLAVLKRDWTVQFGASLAASLIGWIGFITIFNGDFSTPSRQQVIALPQILIIAFLWESRTLLVSMVFDEDE